MSLKHSVLKFLASRIHIPGDALDYYFTGNRVGRGAATALPFPAELIPIGARLFARGWANRKFFPSQRDWILPFWAERQFNPRDPAFIPYGFEMYTINYALRDWTMIGNPAREREAIVDPRGLVTPWFDGWSLDVWIEVDGKLFAPSRSADENVEQSLHENLPIVVTRFRAPDLLVQLETFGVEEAGQEWIVEQIAVENHAYAPRRATLYISVRPFNPEGVSPIKELEFRELEGTRIFVDGALGALISKPAAVGCSDFDHGDVALALDKLNGSTHAQCKTGFATGVAAYHLDLDASSRKTFAVMMPMQKQELDEEENELPFTLPALDSANDLRSKAISAWRNLLAHGMRVRLPDEKLSSAFEANKAYLLLLHDGDTITPGPFTYHQFWFRDAAYLLNALDKLGYHEQTRAVIEKFSRRLKKDGYLRATEGEWDANGQAIWTMTEHARLSGDRGFLVKNYWALLRMASWINSKRRQSSLPPLIRGDKGGITPHHGLLPPGPSAEHLGPSDYFYWDDFWGLVGLRDAATVADWFGNSDDAKKLRENYESFRADIDASLASARTRLGRDAMPASPYRRLDAGMIGGLVALYPLRLFEPNDPRIADTIAALKEVAWMEDAYFNHVGHAALGTYLSLHVAQCYLFQRSPEAWKIIQWLLRHASPTFTWAEGLHPITRRGGMGDGHHGWAAADFVLAVRNALLFEEGNHQGDLGHLVITPALREDWTTENSVIQVENAATYFGDVSFTIAFGDRTGTLVLQSEWREEPEYVEWNLPFKLSEAGGDVKGAQIIGNAVRIPRGSRRVVVFW